MSLTYTSGDPWVGVSTTTPSLTITDDDELAKPTGLKLSVDGTNVQADWTRVTNATGYILQWNSTSSTAWDGASSATITGGATVTRKVTNLTANTTYYFRVLATKSGADNQPSDAANTRTTTTVSGTGDYDDDNDGLIEVSRTSRS